MKNLALMAVLIQFNDDSS